MRTGNEDTFFPETVSLTDEQLTDGQLEEEFDKDRVPRSRLKYWLLYL